MAADRLPAGAPAAALLAVIHGLDELAHLDDRFKGFAARHRLRQDVVEEMRVCLHELVANVFLHGLPEGGRCSIAVSARLDGEDLFLLVEDDSAPFNPLDAPAAILPTSLEDAKTCGFGLHLVRSFTNRMAYEHESGRNRLTLVRCDAIEDSPGSV